MAAAQGKSLKKFIETLLINKANSMVVEANDNPSPSGDTWFDDPENMASVQRGISDMKAENTKAYSIEEIRQLLSV